MKVKTKKTYKKKIIIVLVCLLVLAGIYGTVAFYQDWFPFVKDKNTSKDVNGIDYNLPTDEQKQAGERQKKSTAEQNPDTKTNTSQDQNSNSGGTLQVTITANQNGNIVQIRSFITKISSSGTCNITLTKGSSKVTKSSGIQALPSESTCRGFDISTSELTAGNWQATIVVGIGTQTGSATKLIAVK